MKTWEVVIFCLLALSTGIAILMLTDGNEKIRRKRHPKWYELYDRALSHSLAVGSRFKEKTETINMRTKAIQELFFRDECTPDEYVEAMKTLNKEYSDAVKWFKLSKEALGIDADLRAADVYAKEHNLKWGIIYE